MKVHEIVNEAISITDQTWKVRRTISNYISELIQKMGRQILPDIKTGVINTEQQLVARIKAYLSYHMEYGLALEREFKDSGLRAVYVVPMQNANVGGEADKDAIYLNEKYDNQIISYIAQDFTSPVLDYENIKSFFENYELSYTVKNIIATISSIFIHELVHVRQHKPQHHRIIKNFPVEYRSYIEKDKKKVVKAATDQLSNLDRDIYLATIQEIQAFAHQRAIDIIDIISHRIDVDAMRKYELLGAMANLDDFFEHKEWKNLASFKEYNEFNTPKEENRYKVFKRFMKIVYQELMNFKDRLHQRYNEIKNNEST